MARVQVAYVKKPVSAYAEVNKRGLDAGLYVYNFTPARRD
jgi:hypothetical protein